MDADGRIRSWNAGAERMFRRTAEDAIGRFTHILLAEHEREREHELRNRVYAGELLTVRVAACRADGEIFPAEASVGPLIGVDGNVEAR